MGRFAVILLEPESGNEPAPAVDQRRLRVESSDPEVLDEVAARIGVLYPQLARQMGKTAIEIEVPAAEATALSQAITDLVLRVRLCQRDAPLRARLYRRLLG